MSPENLVKNKPTKLKEKKDYLYSALDDCVKIIDSLEKQKKIFVETQRITDKINNIEEDKETTDEI